ncbi:hypothetical protein P3S68_019623 [Capsicum galapagoense]
MSAVKVQDNLDKIHISTPGTPNHTSLSPITIQEIPVENAYSSHVDQVFDESSHQITDPVHEFDIAFDLVPNISDGLQIPLQVTQVISKPTLCVEPEIDCSADTHSRKSISEEYECLDTNTSIVFDGSLQRNECHLQCQFAYLKLIMTEKSIFHMNLPSNFNGPIGVEGEASLIPHVEDALTAEFFSSITTQSSLADFDDLEKYEIKKDGLPTFYWFDTRQHLSLPIPFVFRHIKCGGLLYMLKFRNIGDHLAAFDAQDSGVIIVGRDAILLSRDAHRKYMWCFEFVVMKLSSLSAQILLRYFLLFPVVQKACYILGRANICGTIAYSYPMTKVWDPRQFWSVNSYISGVIEHQTIGVDIRDISLSFASLTSNADILFKTFLITSIMRCQKTVECLMIFDKIPQRYAVCWSEWIEAYERPKNCDGFFSCYANSFIGMNFNCGGFAMFYISQFLLMVSLNNQTSSSTLTPCAIVLLVTDNMVTWLATKVIKILFLGHPKEEVECYLAKNVAFSEHVLVGSSYNMWEIILFYGTWFQLFGLVAARRHFKSSSGTHTTDLGRRFDLLFRCSFELICTSLVCKMFPSLSISSHVPSSIHEHIRDGVYDRTVGEHNHIESNVLPSQPWAFDNAVVGARLHNSNLEDKVFIGDEGIVMNGPRPVLAKQPKSILSGYVWDSG